MFKLILIFFIFFYSTQTFSLDVNSAIKSTVEKNIKIKIALEKLNDSKELIENALGAKLPTVTGTISGTYSKSEDIATTGTTTPETFTDSYKLTITQNLFDAGYNDLEIERSKILFNNEQINFEITVQNLILDAITGYLTVLNFEKSLEATEKNYESVTKALEEINTKFELGSSTLYELKSAESSFAVANSNLFAANENLIISKKSFNRIVGVAPTNLEDIVNIDNNINFSKSFNKAKNNNLNLKLINNEILNNKILLLKEKKSKSATLDFTGTAEYSDAGRIDAGTESTKGKLALTLTIPIYQKGIDNSNIRKYHSKILQSELNYQDSIDDLEIQISNAFKDYNISM